MSAYPPPRFDTIAYGGNAEDVVLLRAFAGKRDGFFVDVGPLTAFVSVQVRYS